MRSGATPQPHALTLDLGVDARSGRAADDRLDRLRLFRRQRRGQPQRPDADPAVAAGAGRDRAPGARRSRTSAFPVGRPQTVVVNLRGKVPPGTRRVRIVTNMRIYWDQILVELLRRQLADRADPPRTGRRRPALARLLGASRRPDGREPYGYDYARVSTTSPWKQMTGRYTREGDVRPLLGRRRRSLRGVAARRRDRAVVRRLGAAAAAARHDAARSCSTRMATARRWTSTRRAPTASAPLPFHGDDRAIRMDPASTTRARRARAVSGGVQHAGGGAGVLTRWARARARGSGLGARGSGLGARNARTFAGVMPVGPTFRSGVSMPGSALGARRSGLECRPLRRAVGQGAAANVYPGPDYDPAFRAPSARAPSPDP